MSLVPALDFSADDETDGLVRLISVALRRYARAPDERSASSRLLLSAAVALYAHHTSAGDAALVTSEAVAELSRKHRRAQRNTVAQ